MTLMNALRNYQLEEKEPDKLERMSQVAQIIMAVAAVVALFQHKTVWLAVSIVLFLLVSLPSLSRLWRNHKLKNKQKEAVARFADDFQSFVNRAQDFVQSTNQYGIPYYLRNIVTREGMEVKRFNPNFESFYSQVLRNIQMRVKSGFENYIEFERTSREFYDAMDSFVLIFVDDMIRELKQPKNLAALLPYELSGLKQRYGALSVLINEYNGFRSRFAVFWGEKDGSMLIRIPTETID